jgi:hypothetical protein
MKFRDFKKSRHGNRIGGNYMVDWSTNPIVKIVEVASDLNDPFYVSCELCLVLDEKKAGIYYLDESKKLAWFHKGLFSKKNFISEI